MSDCLGAEDQFRRYLEDSPEAFLSAIGIAICEIHYEKIPLGKSISKLTVRLQGHPHVHQFKDLKAFQIGKFINIQGNVLRVLPVHPFPTQVAFNCSKCLQTMTVILKDGILKNPAKCQINRCTGKTFILDRQSRLTQCVNMQRVKIQEILDPTVVDEEGRIPRTLEAELKNDLVDSLLPGETVCISGILKALENSDLATPTASLYLDVISVTHHQSQTNLQSHHSTLAAQQEIQSLAMNKELLSVLVHSFCPHIYGNEMVKFGLLLGLVGGSKASSGSNSNSNSTLAIRSDPHVLIVGDPGLGKSQLLRFAAMIAPRAVYVCANTSTSVGLTASVVEGGLEAGALVLADQGVCCIDEFDKVGRHDGWRALLDVMEQQTVNVAKAGIVCTLPARAAIFAAANPVGGHYNGSKSVVENLRMDAALLSRFDLIFVLLDKPNADMDKVLSEHVLSNVVGCSGVAAGGFNRGGSLLTQLPTGAGLVDRLSRPTDTSTTALLTESQLRSYISHTRSRTNPKMTEEAAAIIQAFYLEIRKGSKREDTLLDLPITTRHLESMIRLAEARAKLELRSFVTAADAADIVELINWCTADVRTASSGGKPASKRPSKSAAIRRFVSELIKVSARTSKAEFSTCELQSLYEAMRISEVPFAELVDGLNDGGYLLRRSSTEYRLLVT